MVGANQSPWQNISFLKKQSVDVSFRDIIYEVSVMKLWRKPCLTRKEILHGVSGYFSAGQLTAIMGPSGAGKSTLLNILAGYTFKGVRGYVHVNNQVRSRDNLMSLRRLSCYIQQKEHLRCELTVHEAMAIAAELKLGSSFSTRQKQYLIKELLEMLGLHKCLRTKTGNLSGGQKKKLSIAFELITNPPVIFLDEPTTGLDSLSCSQIVAVLKTLARQGRTVVCTIHQPSALIFDMFDRVYALTDGYCIYDGAAMDLIPFLSEKGFKCPTYHNPADFLLEVATGEYGSAVKELTKKSEAHLPDSHRKMDHTNHVESNVRSLFKTFTLESVIVWQKSFLSQFFLLYSRNILILQKKYKFRLTTFFSHLLPAVLIGLTFFDTGNEASMVRANVCFIFAVLIFLIYLSKMSVTLTIPNELNVLRVEHFNRWYSLLPYYLSIIVIEIPFQAFNCFIGVSILYYLSNQPIEIFRYSYFLLFCMLTSLTGQAIGFFLGATVPVKIAAFIGPVSAATCSVFGFTVRFCDLALVFKWMSLMSYFQSAFHGIMTVLYGYDRSFLECNDLYCHFKAPKKILDEMDIININIYSNLAFIFTVCIVMHFLTFIVLYAKMNNNR